MKYLLAWTATGTTEVDAHDEEEAIAEVERELFPIDDVEDINVRVRSVFPDVPA